MFSKKQSINCKVISVLLLLVYCFGISSLFISHNHDNHNHEHNHEHNHNHNQELTYCESINDVSNSYNESINHFQDIFSCENVPSWDID